MADQIIRHRLVPRYDPDFEYYTPEPAEETAERMRRFAERHGTALGDGQIRSTDEAARAFGESIARGLLGHDHSWRVVPAAFSAGVVFGWVVVWLAVAASHGLK